MGWRNKYDLEFKGLKEGLHKFNFIVEDSFFTHFEQGLVSKGEIQADTTLEKRGSFMKLFIQLNGFVELVCDRCLDSYNQKVNSKYELFVKFGENKEEDDEIIWISPEEHNINLAQLIYEYIILSLPLKQVHPDKKDGTSGCNQEMLDKLERHKMNEEKNKSIDPRWAALKNWNNNKN